MTANSRFRSLAYASADDVVFGLAPKPVTAGFDVRMGMGEVLPEVDFTLPVMPITQETWPQVIKQYEEMTKGVLTRASRLDCDALGLEIEHLYEMTMEPEWGAQLTRLAKTIMAANHKERGLRSALKVSVADVRQRDRPPRMRSGQEFQRVIDSMEACAEAGADVLAIESTGGKELYDQAIVRGDIPTIMYSIGALACSDVRFLWKHITKTAASHGILPGGDSACAFANTAMQLAHQGYIPRVLAALVRAVSAVRTLCAYEEGARGPGKDCAYENPVIKMITGVPVAMEGKSAACAHSSPLGNIASAVCDLWANESVQNTRLLGGPAPEVCAEMLIYDCRLMNTAHKLGQAKLLRNLFTESDRYRDPQALFLDPEVCFSLAKVIVEQSDDYVRTLKAAEYACHTMQEASDRKLLRLNAAELKWLQRMEGTITSLPDQAGELGATVKPEWKQLFLPEEYGLTGN